jgi:hypothetical protein
LININQNARIRRGIQIGPQRATWLHIPGPRDLQIKALRIQLRAIVASGAVQGDDLVAEDVVARRDGGRDLYQPAVSICDELVVGPVAWRGGTVDEARTADFEEFEVVLVDCAAACAAVCEVVDYYIAAGMLA